MNTQNKTPMRPPLSIIWIYACGQLGWSLMNYCISQINYFYLPPQETSTTAIFPSYLPSITFMGLTLLGILSFSGRFFDAIIDPYIANLSDKKNHRIGKRKFFMAIAALPLAVTSYLIFSPITEGVSWLNAIGLALSIFIFYISFALYVIPYSALISELGHVPEDRLRISTIISITWALGFLIGNLLPALQGFLESRGYPSVQAFKMAMSGFSVLAFIFMMIPVLFLNEKRYTIQNDTAIDFKYAIKAVFKNKNFKYFSISYLLYWISLTFIQSGIIYYVTIIFKMDKNMASLFGVVSFFSSFLFYPLLPFLERKWRKRRIILYSFWIFCGLFGIVILPISTELRFWIISIVAAFPLATFGILPNTIVADIVHQNETETGVNQSGMFYGVAAFMMKLGISIANLIFPSLLILGKSIDNPLGIQLSIVSAVIFCIAGWKTFSLYKEP